MGEQRTSQLSLLRRASGSVSMPNAPSHYIDLQNRAPPALYVKTDLFCPQRAPQLWNSAPEILKGQFWVPLQ